MIDLTLKQKIILDHLHDISNRQIAACYNLSKDTVNKYVKEYEEQRAALLAMNPDMDSSEIIQAFVEQPKYDTKSRGPKDSTLEALDVIEECLHLNEKKCMQGLRKQTMKKIDIHEYLIKQGFDISYSTVKRLTKAIESRHKEAFLRQEYELGDNCEFDWGTVKLDIVANHARSFRCHDWTIDIYHYLRTLKRKPGALHQSTALLQMDTLVKNIYENYYSNNPKIFLDVLELIYEKGVDHVYTAIQILQRLSPLDMSSDKLRIICDREDTSKNPQVGIDHLSIKSKITLSQYDKLRQVQKERMVV